MDSMACSRAAEGKGPEGHAAARGRAGISGHHADSPDGRGGGVCGRSRRADRVACLGLQRPPLAQGERPHRGARARRRRRPLRREPRSAAPLHLPRMRRRRGRAVRDFARPRARASRRAISWRITPSRCAASVRAARRPDPLRSEGSPRMRSFRPLTTWWASACHRDIVRRGAPVNTCRGRAIFCWSASSSCHWAIHPAVRGIAKSTVKTAVVEADRLVDEPE